MEKPLKQKVSILLSKFVWMGEVFTHSSFFIILIMNVLKNQLQALVDFFTIKTALIHQLFIKGEHPFSSFSPWGWGKKEENGFKKRMLYFKIIFLQLFLVSNISAFSQTYSDTTWQRWYGEPDRHENPWHYQHEVHYDQGILLLTYPDQNPYATRLKKTDVNGHILWEKYFNASFQHSLATIVTSENGDTYIGGAHNRSNGVINPLIIKLNACGELEWCKRIFLNPLKISYVMDLKIDQNNDLICLIYGGSDLSFEERTQLIKLTSEGDVLWHNSYLVTEDYPTMVHVAMYNININSDNSYYLSGETGFPDNYTPGEWLRYRTTPVKISEDGKEEWMSPLGVYDEIGSFTNDRFHFVGDGTIWGIMVGDTTTGTQPGKFIFNADGEILDYYFKPILEGITYYNGLFLTKPISERLYASRLNYYLYPQVNTVHRGLAVFDSALNVAAYKLNMDVVADYPMSTIMSHDSLLLDISSCFNCNGSQYSDVYLAKYNADLSFADTIDDTNWVYDSFCEHAIVSDTIYLACDPIGIEELHPPVEKAKDDLPLKIKVNPNPAKNQVKLQLEYITPSEEFKDLSLQVFDIKGNEMHQENVCGGVMEINIKTRKWQSGMYIVIMRSEGIMVGNAKFVIEK